jgi:hypothetical protein
MGWFYKKETLIRTICFMSFFVAINVVCSFLTTVLPLLSIVLIIFLPLTSAIVEVMCKDRWFPIYAVATIGLSIVVSLSSIDFTIFYIVPSIFTGYIFGLFSKHNLPNMFAIFFATIIQTALSFAFIPLLQLITGSNLIDVFVKILKISDRFWFDSVILLIFFLVALIQVILSFIVVQNELNKFGQKSDCKYNQERVAAFSTIGFALLSAIFSFFYMPLCYLFIGIAYYFKVIVVIFQVQAKNKICLITDGVSLLIGIVLYAALNQFIKDEVEFALFAITPGLISIISICDSFLKKSE